MPRTPPWELMFRNLHLLQSVLEEAEPQIRVLGLEMKEFFLLSAIDPHAYPADLARALMLPRPSITFLIKRMETGKFLSREHQPGDLRRFRLTLTPAGRQAVEEAQRILDRLFGQRLHRLNREEIKQFADLLEKMIKA